MTTLDSIRQEAGQLSPEMLKLCEDNGYLFPRLIRGHVCALHRFAFTIGLLWDVTADSPYTMRFCFADFAAASLSLAKWAEYPKCLFAPGPWIKVKGYVAHSGHRVGLDNSPHQLWAEMTNRVRRLDDLSVAKLMYKSAAAYESDEDPHSFPLYQAPLSISAADPLLFREN